ncbi:MAG: 16S rRNA methyltransferase [Candidatus Thorarchaeota archaeon]|jgi:rRNA small subunit pseudouridine methyltransferase Nep1
MLHIILLETALELVPSEISALKSVQRHANRRKKKPTELLLDQSHHGRDMTRLEDGDRRGRPDIIFFCLQSILETPLCKSGLVSIHIHTLEGKVIEVRKDVRLPRNYDRFVGLMEQLLVHGRVPPEGETLLRVLPKDLTTLVSDLQKEGASTLLAVEGGKRVSMTGLQQVLPVDSETPVIVGIGAFPHGDFQQTTRDLFTTSIELDTEVMMAWHVCSELVWTYTHKHGIIAKRYEQA